MSEAFLVHGVRTPIGRYGGSLTSVRPDDLAAEVMRRLTGDLPGIDWGAVDDAYLGCANQAGEEHCCRMMDVDWALLRTRSRS